MNADISCNSNHHYVLMLFFLIIQTDFLQQDKAINKFTWFWTLKLCSEMYDYPVCSLLFHEKRGL